jgi:hypothetical protein
MLKAGPAFRIRALHLFLNPYLGCAWERVSAEHGDQPDDSHLYGYMERQFTKDKSILFGPIWVF